MPKPGLIVDLRVAQTGAGEVTVTWDAHPPGTGYYARWGPASSGWGAKYEPPDGLQNQVRLDEPDFVLAGMPLGEGEVQVVAFDPLAAVPTEKYGPVSGAVRFEVEAWQVAPAPEPESEPEVGRGDEVHIPGGSRLAILGTLNWRVYPRGRYALVKILPPEGG